LFPIPVAVEVIIVAQFIIVSAAAFTVSVPARASVTVTLAVLVVSGAVMASLVAIITFAVIVFILWYLVSICSGLWEDSKFTSTLTNLLGSIR
jgi:hypothetical protein